MLIVSAKDKKTEVFSYF